MYVFDLYQDSQVDLDNEVVKRGEQMEQGNIKSKIESLDHSDNKRKSSPWRFR